MAGKSFRISSLLGLRLAILGMMIANGFMPLRSQAQNEPMTPARKFAVLIGVNDYPNPPLDKTPLRFAKRDVEELGKLLKSQGYQTRLLIGPVATKANIDEAIGASLDGMAPDDLLVIALAGHGVQLPELNEDGQAVVVRGKPQEDVMFCPYNARLVRGRSELDRSTLLSLSNLVAQFETRAGRKVVMMDACRNLPRDPTRTGIRAFSGDELNGRLPGNTVVMFACSAGQFSRESEQAGGGHGIYCHHVLEGLGGKAAFADTGEVTPASLQRYLIRNVDRSVQAFYPGIALDTRGRAQTPHTLSNLQEDVVLATRGMGEGSEAGDRMKESGLGSVFVWCPAGRFTMGSPKDEAEREKDEDQVEVELSRGFWMGEHEVTQGDWQKVMGTSIRDQTRKETYQNYKKLHGEGANYPMYYVSWEEAREFCRKLTEQERKAGRLGTGWEYRLPSEAEWEYACRAGTTTRYWFGDDSEGLAKVGNVSDASAKKAYPNLTGISADDGFADTAPVGRFAANKWGLKDMHGNVREWCEDEYKEELKGGRDPLVAGGEKAGYRVYRGGGWRSFGRYCRSASRGWCTPGSRYYGVGFRLVLGPSRQRN